MQIATNQASRKDPQIRSTEFRRWTEEVLVYAGLLGLFIFTSYVFEAPKAVRGSGQQSFGKGLTIDLIL
jgi:hypothetical protein